MGIRRYLSNIESRFPSEALFLAYIDDTLHGWAALDRNGKSLSELGRWQPIVKESDSRDQVAYYLLESIFSYASSRGISQLETMLSEVDASSEKEYEMYRKWYKASDMTLLEESAYLVRSLDHGELELRTIPEGINIKPLDSVSETDLYDCYYQAFLSGEDNEFLNMNEGQRREKFESAYNNHSLNRHLSCVLVEKEKVIGFAIYLSRDEEEHLDRFGVREEYRGIGIAKSFLVQTMHKAKAIGTKMLSLGVDTSNRSAYGLYKNVGFTVESRMIVYFKNLR
ncbi:MAG: GNAT family N-acetyltransferase [Candidatus Thorarchaeota archaeon]